MSFRRQHIRNTRAIIEAGTPLIGEYPYDNDLKTIRVGDGATLGGVLLKKWGKSKVVAPAQITASQNNYNPSDLAIAETLVLDLDADRSVTGLSGAAADRELSLYNGSAFRLTLINESASSTVGNRFSFGADLTLRPGQGLRLFYSAALARWLALGRSDLGVTILPENLELPGDITPAQITADQNDYNPSGLSLASRLRLSTDASRNVTGIVGGSDGRLLIVINVGSNALVLKDADAASTAAYRFDFGGDLTLSGKQAAVLQYDASDSRWKVLAHTAGTTVADGAVTAVKLGGNAVPIDAVMINGALVESHAGNAVTFALKTLAGADPSGSDPVRMVFPNDAGTLVQRDVSAALSITVSAGSTLGYVANQPGRVWLLAINTGSAVVLGVVNCRKPSGVFNLNDNLPINGTAEGGAGGADSAAVIYTAAAQSGKPFRIIGYTEYQSGLATAGNWNVSPEVIRLFGPGCPRPGAVVQADQMTTATATSTTSTSYQDTALSLAFQPTSKINAVDCDFSSVIYTANGGASAAFAALHRDGTQVGPIPNISSNAANSIWAPAAGNYLDFPGSTSALSYNIKVKAQISGTAAAINYPLGCLGVMKCKEIMV